jgi:hypothetical protein
MISLYGRRKGECNNFRDALGEVAGAATVQELLADASSQQRAHAAACEDCHKALEELLATRLLLSALPPQRDVPRPWFASRVMSAIAARGSESIRLATAWTVVPKLASRLAWVSAVAILVASTWLYQKPVTSPAGQSVADPSAETLFETPSQPANQDDVLVSMVEKGQ